MSAQAALLASEEAPTPRLIALLGNPNTGKTTLFNHLCGLRAKTANFPGTTTDARVGQLRLDGTAIEVVDLPGAYGLNLDLPESRICHDVLVGSGVYRKPDMAIVVIDATNLRRNLRLVCELLAFAMPTVVVLNMVDLARRRGLSLDTDKLSAHLGCPVVPMVARRGEGIDDLKAALLHCPSPEKRLLPSAGEQLEPWCDNVIENSVGGKAAIGSQDDSLTQRLDLAFTHPLLGAFVFMGIMGALFWAVFALATVPMDLIELTFEGLGGWLGQVLPDGAVRDLLVDGVVGGIAGTVVFLPQICLLFFLISLLEDTGYLSRAAFVMDRLLCRFGLPGHAFVPLLSSHACALPGIMSSRLIPDRQDRLATILVAPFMSCSARMPVYVLLTGLLFADRPAVAGLAFAGCYLLGGAAALISAFFLRRSLLKGRSRPMVLELPTYKMPSLRTALYTAIQQGGNFIKKAGTVIVGICIVMWWLSTYPLSSPPPEAQALYQQAEIASVEEADRLRNQADRLTARHSQSESFAGRLGRLAQPVFAPLGYDWQLTVGVLTSFLAREVFVSTMAVLTGGDPEASEQGVLDQVAGAVREDGSLLFGPATSASLLVFFVLAMQCLPTLAVTRREAGGMKWAVFQLAYMSGLAWVAALITYQAFSAWAIG